jgi:hypothetical protein
MEDMMKRMSLTVDGSGMVEISYTDPITDESVTRRFRAGQESSYVQEHLRGGRTAQVCDGLAGTGSTLRGTRAALPGIIRAEYRKMLREVARDLGRR